MEIQSIENNLNFDKFKAKQEKLPRDMVLEAKIIRNYLQTKNSTWLDILRYKSRTKNSLIREFKEYWSQHTKHHLINDIVILFNFKEKTYERETITTHHSCKEKPIIIENTKTISIHNLEDKPIQYNKSEIIIIHESNPICVNLKNKTHIHNYKIS